MKAIKLVRKYRKKRSQLEGRKARVNHVEDVGIKGKRKHTSVSLLPQTTNRLANGVSPTAGAEHHQEQRGYYYRITEGKGLRMTGV